jgi:hypothetical protein
MTSLYMVSPSALPRKVPPCSSFWTRPLSGESPECPPQVPSSPWQCP